MLNRAIRIFKHPDQLSRWIRNLNRRNISKLPTCMRAWIIQKYGTTQELSLVDVPLPKLASATDVLIRVHATSVNPLDVKMLSGYGSRTLPILRRFTSFPLSPFEEFPMILGRDFSGEVVYVGADVKDFKPGDEVWGAISADRPGSHAEYVVAPSSCLAHKPKTLHHSESAAIPYVALTAMSAISLFGRLNRSNLYGKQVLVLGASGGVGTFAVQLLKAWNSRVIASCSSDAEDLVTSLGVDDVIEYTSEDYRQGLLGMNRFDVVLDCVGKEPEFALQLLKRWQGSKYITVVPPLLRNADQYGFVPGFAISGLVAAQDTLQGAREGRCYIWAFFCPDGKALKNVTKLVDSGKIIPVVEKVFTFNELPLAYERQLAGHARGKVVISLMDKEQNRNDS